MEPIHILIAVTVVAVVLGVALILRNRKPPSGGAGGGHATGRSGANRA